MFITEAGQTQANWIRWGMTNPTGGPTVFATPDHTAKMIQGSFGYYHATTEAEIGLHNHNFVWSGGRGQTFVYRFGNVNWISSFWNFYHDSIIIRRKTFQQWQEWMEPFQHAQYQNYYP